MTTPSKAEQAAEGAAREEARAQQQIENGIEPGMVSTEAEVPPEPIAETAPDVEGQIPTQSKSAPRNADATPKAPLPRQMTPADRSRMEIAARIRQRRNGGQDQGQGQEDDGSLEQAMRDELPPELAEAPPAAKREPAEEEGEAEVEVDASAQTPPPPPEPSQPVAKRKLKVLGQEVELTQEEIESAARKTLAAEDYLEKARKRMEDASAIQQEVITLQRQLLAERAGQPPKSPGDATNTQTTDGADDQADGVESHDPAQDVIETIQYGDPADAKEKLRAFIKAEAEQQARAALTTNRNETELERSQRQLKEFQDQNAELAADTMARNAIQGRIMELQRDDLLNLGYKAENLPIDLSELANMHLRHRGQGHNVRQIGTLLTTARDDYVKWRGGPAQTQAPAAVPAQSQPQQQTTQTSAQKVAVNVDRTDRRAVIPQQPKSSVTPRLEVPVQRSAAQNRQSAINKMINDRNRVRGSSAIVG